MKSKWITHAGQKIFLTDYTNQTLESLQAEMQAAEALICQQPEGSVLVLSDVRGTVASPQVLALSKQSSVRCQRYVRKQAIVGLLGAPQTLLDILTKFSGQKNFQIFNDIEQAKDWLIRA